MKDKIEAVFEKATNQEEALIELYKLVFPDWEEIITIRNWPSCGKTMWGFICKKFIEFDRKHHPKIMAGGIWLNNGFSCNKQLNDWDIDLTTCEVIRK